MLAITAQRRSQPLICDRFFYYPNKHAYDSPGEHGLSYESVNFRTRDGVRLSGWFFPASTIEGQHDVCGTVLHLHGNAGNMTGHFQHVAWLPAAGWNVLCFDYRGYGESQGSTCREGTIFDAHAALDYLLTRPDVDARRITAFGQSLGGAISIVLTAERPEIHALATDGAFDNYRRIAGWHIRHNPWLLPVAWWVPHVLMSNGYDPIDYVGRIAPRPLFIIHGTADAIVPVDMARRLYAAAGDPKQLWLVEGADHYDPLRNHDACGQQKLIEFFAQALES